MLPKTAITGASHVSGRQTNGFGPKASIPSCASDSASLSCCLRFLGLKLGMAVTVLPRHCASERVLGDIRGRRQVQVTHQPRPQGDAVTLQKNSWVLLQTNVGLDEDAIPLDLSAGFERAIKSTTRL